MPSILFVCTANVIRSPFACAAFKKKLFDEGFDMKNWKVDSAGTWTVPNLAIEQRTVSIASELIRKIRLQSRCMQKRRFPCLQTS